MTKLKISRSSFVKTILENSSFFLSPVFHEKTREVRRVQVAGILDLPIVQQPEWDERYVSPLDGQITEFRTPSRFGNVGLLAHNELAGRLFCRLAPGQEVHLLYGRDRIETFRIADILRYQALQPDSPFSPVRDLVTGKTLTAAQLFEKTYMGSRHVTFQTCIAAPACATWGRLFVIATRKDPSGSHRWN